MRQFKFYLLITAFPAIFSASLQAQDAWQSHASIRERVTQFVIAELGAETDLQVEPGRLDRRLKLVKCLQPLDAFWPPGARQYGNTSVGISCEGEKPWKIYVQASVEVLEQVAVLDRLAVKGEPLSQDMVRYEKKDISRLGKQYINDISRLMGYRFKRSTAAGRMILPGMLEVPLLVQRGQRVTIISKTPGLQVRMQGEALTDGGQGKVIRVKNLSSQRIVQGEVVGKGIVEILN